MVRRERLGAAVLVALTAVWGSTFFLIHDLLNEVPSSDFLAVRFSIAALVLIPFCWKQIRGLERREIIVGLGIGVLYTAGQLLQTVGLEHTDASRSGFITGTYVVLTPVFGALLLRERPPTTTWIGVVLATAGLAVLSLRGFGVGYGETLTLIAAALYALHILALGRSSAAGSVAALAALQVIVIAVVCTVIALPDGIQTPSSGSGWASLIYMAVIAGAGALLAQTWGQAQLPAARAAIIMTLEPVFASGFAVIFGQDSLTARMLIGGSLMVGAMLVVEAFRPVSKADGAGVPPSPVLHHEPS